MSDLLIEEATPQVPSLSQPPDFRIFTSAVQVIKSAEELTAYTDDEAVLKSERPRVGAVGSSNVLDLQGDVMELSALQDMTKALPGMLCFLNHSYNVPEDVAGALADHPKIVMQGHIADLHILINMNMRNPRAVACYEQFQDGLRLGISGGFLINDYELDDEDDRVRLHVLHVTMLEDSFVGIPANPRSWVEYAARGLFTRTWDEKLASIVKSLYSPRDYAEMLSGQPDMALRKHLAGIPARSPRTKRVFWVPARKTFALNDQGRERDLAPEEVEALFEEVSAPVQKTVEPPEQKAASDEDKAAQEKRSKTCGIGIKEGGHVSCPGEYSSFSGKPSWWGDYCNYRYPLDTKAHADNAASRWGDESNRSQYNSKEQGIIAGNIEARQRSFGEEPDDKEKALDPTETATKAVEVDSKGNHAAFDGTHEHSHPAFGSQGGDETHTHAHSHSGDSVIHDHHGSDGKSLAPDKAAAGIPIADDGTHDAMDGTHGHAHADGAGGMHEHDHEHTGEANHVDHSHESVGGKSTLPSLAAALPEAERKSLINLYDYAASRLGAPDFKQACGLVPDAGQAQQVISMVSSLDMLSDQLADGIDTLMGTFGIPDIDASSAVDSAGGYAGYSAADLALCKALGIVAKQGARHSASDMTHIQSVHDLSNKLGASCPAATQTDELRKHRERTSWRQC